MIIIPTKWLFHWGYTLFSDIPIWYLFHGYVPMGPGPTRPAPHHLGSPPGQKHPTDWKTSPGIRTWSTHHTKKLPSHWHMTRKVGRKISPKASCEILKVIQWLLPGSHSVTNQLGRQHCFMPAAADAKSPWRLSNVSDLQNMAVGWCPRLLPTWFITPITRAYGGAIYI